MRGAAAILRRVSARRPVFVHVGSSKTGTSALQRGLWDSVDALAKEGVGVPFVGRQEHVRRLLRPLGWEPATAFVNDIDRRRVRELTRLFQDTPGDRLLISNEDLAEAGPEQIAAFAEAADAARLEIHVVLTARDWAKQLPSEWQQLLKHRLTTDYQTFLTEVRDRVGSSAEQYWRRQDVLDICARWGAATEPARFHLIPVPAMRVDPDAVFRFFGQVVGYDPAVIRLPGADVNASFGYVEAEVLRRLNIALGDRLPDYGRDYMPAIRRTLIQRVLARQASTRIPLPPEHLGWVRTLSRERLDAVLARGLTVYGDPDTLVPGPDAAAPMPQIDDAAVAEAAIRTLADFAVRLHDRPPSPPGPAADGK